MADSWQLFGQQVNAMFNDTNRATTGKKFKQKHGNNGHGNDPGTVPYRFGLFAVDSVQPSDQPKWLIDTGTRHWDNTITDIQNAVIDSLTQPPGQEYPMNFVIQKDAPGPTAYADVVKTNVGGQTSYNVTIHCPPYPP
jgi:hypothetical protein